MSEVSEDMDQLPEDASEEELGVVLFVGKLRQLIAAGADFGVPPEQLHDLLVAINLAYEDLKTPGVGRPN